jgi:hypothetical protein
VTRRRTTTAPPELRQARVKNAILREQITERRLQRQAKVLESAPWVEPYAELIGRLAMRDLQFRGPATRNDRRYGVDYPMARTEQELSLLRAPSRVLLATNSYAIGLANGITNYVVGPKTDIRATCDDPGVQSACQDVLDEFVKLNDYHGGLKPSVERENFWRGLEDGEWINLLFPQADGTTHIRMVDPEQVTQPPGTDFREWGFGKCADPDDPEAVEAFWITFGGTANEGKEYDVSRVVWNKRNTKRSMKFGLPDYCDSTHDLLMLAGKIAMNLGTATEMQASVAGVRQHTGATVDQVQGFVDENTDHQRLDVITNQLVNVDRRQPGRMEDIGENTEYVSGPSAEWGMVHLEILAGVLMGASRRWCAPRWLATGDASDSNYSNALSEGSPFVKQVLAEQAAVTASNVRAAEYALEHWCRTNGLEVKSEGGLVARTLSWPEVKRLVKVECTATSPIAVERLAETQRRAIMNQAGVLSVQTWQQQEELDPETEQANTDEYRERNPMMGDPLAPFGQQQDDQQGGQPAATPTAESLMEMKDASGHEHAADGKFGTGGATGGNGSEREVSKLAKAAAGKQLVTQPRAKSGGEVGPNGEDYPGGAFIATQDVPKRIKDKLQKSAAGKVQVDGHRWEVPAPGQMSILDKMGGTVLNPRDGSVNYNYLEYSKATADEVKAYEEVAEKWKAGERWVSVNDYPQLAGLKDAARLVVAGQPVPGAILDKMPAEWQAHLTKYKPAGGGGGGPKPQPPPAAGPVAESKDDSGHEHKGKGPGGGQFTSGGGGGGSGGTDDKQASKSDPTRSKAFKAWFGDSKVVDGKGKPLVVYHGTGADFDEFTSDKSRQRDGAFLGQGHYFTTHRDRAEAYAQNNVVAGGGTPNVKSVYLSIENPYMAKMGEAVPSQSVLIGRGHDGVILNMGPEDPFLAKLEGREPNPQDEMEIVAFQPHQIKSVGNRGTFDPASAKIHESKDASGHEHKGKGEGGGQFTSGGGGAGGAGAKGGKNKKAPDDVKGSAMTPAWSDVPKEVADRLVAQQAEAANQIRARQGKPAVEYDLKFLPLGDVKPSQTGEDYDNASSRDLATRITKYDPDERPADYAPIAVDEAGVIVDGNHRHAAHTFAGLDSIPVLVPKGGDAAKPLAGKLTSHLAGVEHAAQTGDVATVRAHLADVLKGRSKAELAEAATAMGYNVKGDSGKKIVELLSQHYERMAVSAMRSKVIRGEI